MFPVSFQKTMNIMISSYAFLLFLLVNTQWTSFAKKSNSRSDDAELARFIIGGYLAQDKQYPYAVSVHEYDEESRVYDHVCTFSLITTKSILGAAHCMIGENGEIGEVENYFGVLGNVDSQNRTNRVTFAEIRIHANYEDEDFLNDIVIVVLSKAVKTGDYIKTIPLAGPSISFVGMHGITMGWGQTSTDKVEASRYLRYVDVDIVANEVCENYFDALDEDQFCYGTEGKGTCDGDSGAPIVVMFKNKKVQMGIASHGSESCAREPSVGVSVSSYYRWIRSNVKGNPVFVK